MQHGLSLLRQDTETSRRLAMLSIDNAVELSLKTYLGLPKRISGLAVSRKEYQEISENFPALLDALESHAPNPILQGIDLGEIEWFHRLRNELYHQGNGLTIEKEKVEVYAGLAALLFRNLFGYELDVQKDRQTETLGRFLGLWQAIERLVETIGEETKTSHRERGNPMRVLDQLYHQGLVNDSIMRRFSEQRQLRNRVVHGQERENSVDANIIRELEELVQDLEQVLGTTKSKESVKKSQRKGRTT